MSVIICTRDLTESDLNITIWRYMSFPKFMSLLTYQALWFSKLNNLEDGLEGTIPPTTKIDMQKKNKAWKKVFNTPEYHQQIDQWSQTNEDNGRELVIANCWFVGESESKLMWKQYTLPNPVNGVAIKSKPRKLLNSVLMNKATLPQMGMIKYVDHSTHDMGPYIGSQAIERAFIKDRNKFSHEQELRLAALNLKTPCLRPDGTPYTIEEINGPGMNNFENPGLYVRFLIDSLIDEVVVSPYAPDYLYFLVRRVVEEFNVKSNVVRSVL